MYHETDERETDRQFAELFKRVRRFKLYLFTEAGA